MARIQQLLEGRDDLLEYELLLRRFPWLVERNLNCILSPDSDGLLCGLLMSHYLNWKVSGLYDGKVMLLSEGLSPGDCVFLDIEVYRVGIRSVGHHMLVYNSNDSPVSADKYAMCVQPNLLRNYDVTHQFRLKYPLATVHLLLGILGFMQRVQLPDSAICPLLFTDGTYKVMYSYPENVLNWLNYLGIEDASSILRTVFRNQRYFVHTLMFDMDQFFRERDQISVAKERGDRLRISEASGAPCNITAVAGGYSIADDAKERIERFLNMLATRTGWNYVTGNWEWSAFQLRRFTKDNLDPLSNARFKQIVGQNPLSWAVTSNTQIEYTLERPDSL